VVFVNASHSQGQVSVLVLFSADEGTTWQPVSRDPANGEVVVGVASLLGGPRCVFRAIATAGLQSAFADTPFFELPRNPRQLHLSLPTKCTCTTGPVALAASVNTRGLGAIAPQDIHWSSDLDGEIGFGYTLTADLRPGQHQLTVTAPDGLGGTISERGIIIVGG